MKLGLALQTLTPRLAESLGLDPRTRGAVVAEVAPGGQAAAAGVREGDVILEIDRQRVATADEAVAALGAARKGGHLVRLAHRGRAPLHHPRRSVNGAAALGGLAALLALPHPPSPMAPGAPLVAEKFVVARRGDDGVPR